MTPRGIRNNNPGNIRVGQAWRGLASPRQRTPEQRTETEFDVFIAPIYGIRALARLLRNYQRNHKLWTIEQIIQRYAPSHENDVKAYANHVGRQMGVGIYEPINLSESDTMQQMVEAIIRHENGVMPYTHEIHDGITLAGV